MSPWCPLVVSRRGMYDSGCLARLVTRLATHIWLCCTCFNFYSFAILWQNNMIKQRAQTKFFVFGTQAKPAGVVHAWVGRIVTFLATAPLAAPWAP